MAKKRIRSMIILSTLSIYFIFLAIDVISKSINHTYSIYLKYISILLCFCLSLFSNHSNDDKKDIFLLQLALFFTIIADFFLVILNRSILGIIFFIFVQITYIIRHSREKQILNNVPYWSLTLYCIILIILLQFRPPYVEFNLLITGSLYGYLLVISLITAIHTFGNHYYSPKQSQMIAWGMFLFFLCDLNVGLFNLIDTRHTFLFSHIPSGFFIWVFYLPSQLLLALSGTKNTY